MRSTCIDNFRGDKDDEFDPIDIIKTFPPGDCYCGIDARNLPPHLIPHKGVIWFQCPWDLNPGQLIREFLLNAAPKIVHEDSYVCVGITKHHDYIQRYQLESILGENLLAEDDSTEVLKSYTFLGADDKLIKSILDFGYRHEGHRDIHYYIRDYHVTLIFQRKKPVRLFSNHPDITCDKL